MAKTLQTTSRREFLCGLGAVAGLVAVAPCANAYAFISPSAQNTTLYSSSIAQAHMGTFVHITARSTSQSLLDDALERAFTTATVGEKTFTRHNSNGLGGPLVELNECGIVHNAPSELVDIILQSQVLSTHTGNAFNAAVAPILTALADYKVNKVNQLPRSVQKDLSVVANPQAIVMTGKTIKLRHADMQLTLDGMAKGRVVDMMAESLEKSGITDYCINTGGDIRVSTSTQACAPHNTPKAWNIGIQDAKAPAHHNGVLRLSHGAVATSANHESLAVHGHEHLVSLQDCGMTAAGLQHQGKVLSATVVAPNCAQADAMATAIFVMAQEHGVHKSLAFMDKVHGYACQLQTEQGLFASKAWPV
ncbi:MAG: FAD:protein FMN transferase [Pseudomonadota bacterium]